MPVRIPVVALVLVLGLTCGVIAVAVLSASPGVPSAPGETAGETGGAEAAPPSSERYAVGVVHAWDARRAAAWASGDRTALSGLYTPGSAAGLADVELLRRYLARGLVVRDLRMQVLRARVLVARPRRLALEVTDRLAAATVMRADDHAVARSLPADGPTTRRLVLRRDAGDWRMARVSVVPPSAGR
jgi:hypothetical protein